jgi:WD40 repeat protein
VKLVIALVLVSCSGPAKSPTVSGAPKPPGMVWSTESQAWHVPHAVWGVGATADVAMLGGGEGWMVKLDLRTGKVLREKRIAPVGVSLYDVAHIGNDKWIAVGSTSIISGETSAYAFDGNLESTKIPLTVRPDKSFAIPQVAVTTEGVVIAGRGLPLAVYDPTTWAVKTTLDPQLGWGKLGARGAILIANKDKPRRFDLSTNGQRPIGERTTSQIAVGDGIDVMTTYESGKWIAMIYPEGKPAVKVPDAVLAIAIDNTGKRLITSTKTELRIHALPTGEIKKQIPLGDMTSVSKISIAGTRALVHSNGVVRLADLDAGTLSPIDDSPRRPSGIAVDSDGTILLAATSVTRMQGGKVLSTEKIGDAVVEVIRPDDTKRYATSMNDRKTFQVRTVGNATPTGAWDLPETPDQSFITRDGAMVFDINRDGVKQLVRTKGVTTVAFTSRNFDSDVIAIDPDGDALISLDGRVAVVGSDGKPRSTLRIPNCEKVYAWGAIEAGGPRAATYNKTHIAVWDRTSGKLLGTGEFGRVPVDIVFPPKRAEVLIVFDDQIHFWAPGKSMRSFPQSGVTNLALSKDGKRLALAFHDGHVAVYDFDAVLASLKVAELPKTTTIADKCSETDPLSVPPPEKPEPEDDGTANDSIPDPCGE